MRKKLVTVAICCLALFANPICSSASSLDDVVSSKDTETEVETVENEVEVETEADTVPVKSAKNSKTKLTNDSNEEYIESLKEATKVEESATANKINSYISKFISIVVQVISYGIVALLTVSVLLDLAYIVIPILRKILANGHVGTAQQQNNQQGGGLGFGGMNNSFGGGMSSGFGGGFNSGFGGMPGMSGMNGMNGMQNQQQGVMGNLQLVSDAALNAVASEKSGGNVKSALSIYSKDMSIKLVLTPVLLVLALSGVLTNLGMFIGNALTNFLSGIVNMV